MGTCHRRPPAGIAVPIPDFGVFPNKEDNDDFTIEDLEQQEIDTGNYWSLEDYADKDKVMQKIMDPQREWVKVFSDEGELSQYLGGEKPIFNPFGLVLKEIKDERNETVGMKERLILDSKITNANKAARCRQRVVLPRVVDPVHNAMKLLRWIRRHKLIKSFVSWLIADYEDAFWMIPLRKRERRFQCARFGGKVMALLRTGQGTKKRRAYLEPHLSTHRTLGPVSVR